VYAPPGKKNQGHFSLDLAVKTLELYEDYFRVPYPLPKLDMVAIPEFAAGAMENWGLITYREVEVLVDTATASNAQLQRVALVITHEIAHQWFGNLVTMEWWDNLWLNEGFASFMQYWSRDRLYPDWKMWEQYTITEMSSAMQLDSLKSSHPIQVDIKHAEEVEEVFDAISYNKGSCVVRMLYHVLGEEHFREGLIHYFKRFAYGNTTTDDLWGAWEKVSGKPIGKIMNCWTLQMGYPLVTVLQCERGSSDQEAVLTLRQDWFLGDGAEMKEDEKKVWSIPLFVGTKDCKEPKLVMMDTEVKEVKVSVLSFQEDWITINYGRNSMLRTAYTPDMLVKLQKATLLNDTSLPAENRAAMIDDAYALVKAGKKDVIEVIKLIQSCEKDSSYVVWHQITSVLHALDGLFQELPPDVYSQFQRFAAKTSKSGFLKYGWNPSKDDGHLDNLARAMFINLQATFEVEDDSFLNEAIRRFHEYCSDPAANAAVLPSDFMISVFQLVLKTGDSDRYNELKDLYQKLTNNVDRVRVLKSLGYTRDLKLKKQTMDWAVESIPLQDFFYAFSSVHCSGVAGRAISWNFFKEELLAIKKKIGSASTSITCAVIRFCASRWTTRSKADEIESFFKENPIDGTQRKISQILERIRIKADLLDTIKNSLVATSEFWSSLSRSQL